MAESSSKIDRLLPRTLVAGAIGLACCFGAWVVWGEAFFRGYLVGYIFCVGILLGSLAIEMIYRLTGGGWGEMIHRPIEAAIQTLPLAALFFLPIAAGLETLYPWANESEVARDAELHRKSSYLNADGFIIRAIICFAVWIVLSFFLARWSRQLDRTGDQSILRRLGILSGPGAVLFALAGTVAAIDWQMSLEPHWSSTIFPVIFGISQVLAGLAFSILAVTVLARHPRVIMPVGKLYLQDLGSLLLAFVVFWAYVSFAQFLLIWSGNLPEETQWYLPRIRGGWLGLVVFLALCQFALPFLLLLSKKIKRDYRMLGAVAAFILAMHLIDVYWQVMPAFPVADERGPWRETLVTIAAVVGIGGILLAAFLRQEKILPLPPLSEPPPPPEDMHG